MKKIVVAFLVLINFSCNQKIVYCGQNNTMPVVIRKKPEKAYKDFTKEYNYSLKLALKKIGNLDLGDLGFESKEQVISLREKLNQTNILIQELLKSSYYAYSQDPCNETLKNKHSDLVLKIANEVISLKSITTQLDKLYSTSNFNKDIYDEIKKIHDGYFSSTLF